MYTYTHVPVRSGGEDGGVLLGGGDGFSRGDSMTQAGETVRQIGVI